MTGPAGRFQDAPALKPEPFHRGVHGPNNFRRGVVSIEGRGTGGGKLVLGQKLGNLGMLRAPVVGWRLREDLGHSTPADVFDQNRLFCGSGAPIFGFDLAQRFNRRDVRPKLLFQPTGADLVGFGDPVIADANRYATSGGSKM